MRALYRKYRDASDVPVVPDVIPGFNDRGTRPAVDHFVIPRRWAAARSYEVDVVELNASVLLRAEEADYPETKLINLSTVQ